jgi:hypothetical protein
MDMRYLSFACLGVVLLAGAYAFANKPIPIIDPSATYSGVTLLCEGEVTEIPFPEPNPSTAQELKCEGFVSLIPSVQRRYPVYGGFLSGNDVFPPSTVSSFTNIYDTHGSILGYSPTDPSSKPPSDIKVKLNVSIFSPYGGDISITKACMNGFNYITPTSPMYVVCTNPREFPYSETVNKPATCGTMKINVKNVDISIGNTDLWEPINATNCVYAMWGVTTHYQDRFTLREGGNPSLSGFIEYSTNSTVQ